MDLMENHWRLLGKKGAGHFHGLSEASSGKRAGKQGALEGACPLLGVERRGRGLCVRLWEKQVW